MGRWHAVAIAVVLAAVGGCTNDDAFTCLSEADCNEADGGVCVQGFCAFPDAECPSGYRYGEFSGNRSNKCVPVETAEDTDGLPPVPATSSGSSGSMSATSDASTTSGATTSTTTSTTTTGPSETETTAGDCSPIGGECVVPEDCCSACSTCEGGSCVARTGDTEPCGECQACDATGECSITMDASCDAGDMIDCSEYVHGLRQQGSVTSCMPAAGIETGRCDALGACQNPSPQDCTEEGEDALVVCSSTCIANEAACTPGNPSAGVSTASLCATEQTTAGCSGGTCSMQGGLAYVYELQWCTSSGFCGIMGDPQQCTPYVCNAGGCLDSCDGPEDCFVGLGGTDCLMNECIEI